MLEVTKLKKTYGHNDSAFTALKGVNLTIKDGETIAVVGKSGSGKSTLMHLLIGLDTPSGGDVKSNGKSIYKIDTDNWRGDNVGIIFQQFFLQNNDSVVENVALPLKVQGVSRKERIARAHEALEQVGLKDKARNKANDLSGGQKQRVAIARALITKPSILVADEPTGNLDTENGEAISKLLFELNKSNNTTLLMITHDEDLANRCQRVVRLKDGEVISIEKGLKQ